MIIKNLKLKKMCLESGINFKTYQLLFKDAIKIPKNERNTYENEIAYWTLDHFMNLTDDTITTKIKKLVLKICNLNLDRISYDKDLKLYKYQYKDKTITFDMLSNKTQDENTKKELLSKKRYGKCQERSIQTGNLIENSKVVTGYVTIKNIKFWHTIVEFVKDNETMVIDYTKNLYISKEQYYDLTKFIVIASIDSKMLVEDIKKYEKFPKLFKMFMSFRDEMISNLEKNKHLFDKVEDKTKQLKL